MKNNSSNVVGAAVEKLERAVMRLERAGDKLKPQLPRLDDIPELEQRVAAGKRENAILREAVGRVAARLDGVIGRVNAGLKGR